MTYTSGRLWRQISEPTGWARLYGYDGLGRLNADTTRIGSPGDPCPPPNEETGAECPDFYQAFPTILETHAFSYDSAGNRRDQSGTYTTGNRITGFASCTYATDADGNVTRRTCGSQKDSIVWDAANRPYQIRANNDQTIVDLNYDAFGRLAKQVVNGTVRYLLWDGDRLFAELNGSDGTTRAEYSYYPGLDNLHALIVGGTHYYAHADGLGNVIALTDTAKVLKRSYDYDAWGQPTGGSDFGGLNGADRARFKGALWFGEGGTEFYYMRNRWYEAKTGRFLSEDPIWLEGGINLYSFAANDPVNGSDPTGLMEKYECGWVDVETPTGPDRKWRCWRKPELGGFWDFGIQSLAEVRWRKLTSNRILKGLLEEFAKRYGLVITVYEGDVIEIGGRCPEPHAPRSLHCKNSAVDFYTEGFYREGNEVIFWGLWLFATAQRPDLFFGIGWYFPAPGAVTGHIHFDIRTGRHCMGMPNSQNVTVWSGC